MTPEELQQIAELIGGLSSEMQALSARVEDGFRRIEERFDQQEAWLKRHGGLLDSGSRWVNRLNQWSERVDRVLATEEHRIDDLNGRVRKLEGGNGGPRDQNSAG